MRKRDDTMTCTFCEQEIESEEPEWVLVSNEPIVNHFCCLGCLSGHVEELEMQTDENSGLVN